MRLSSRRKTWVWVAAALLALIAVAAAIEGPRAYRMALVGSGFTAEMLCGAVFVSGRDEQSVRASDLRGPGYELLRYFGTSVDRDKKRVSSSAYGLAEQTAIFRDGLGCTLMRPPDSPLPQ